MSRKAMILKAMMKRSILVGILGILASMAFLDEPSRKAMMKISCFISDTQNTLCKVCIKR